jgi:hypothetical protein
MPSVPEVKPLPTPVSAADTRSYKPVDATAVAYKSLISNTGGNSGLTTPATTAKRSLLGA